MQAIMHFPQDLKAAMTPLLPATVPLRINEIDIGKVRIEQNNGGIVIIPDDKAKTIIERMMMK